MIIDNKDCWAKWLGDCEGGITREHLISKNILPHELSIKGLRWCKEKEITFNPKSSFVSKILCKKHNNLLSDYDSEAGVFLQIVEKWAKVSQKFEKYGFTINEVPIKYEINGNKLEKWLTKTLINFVVSEASQGINVQMDKILPVIYSDKLNFESPYGFYLTSEVGEKFDDKFFSFIPLLHKFEIIPELAGGLITFLGLKFIIILPNTLEPEFENGRLKSIANSQHASIEIDWARLRVSRHHRLINEQKTGRKTGKKFITQSLKFTWAESKD